jgi:hypothetical protein
MIIQRDTKFSGRATLKALAEMGNKIPKRRTLKRTMVSCEKKFSVTRETGGSNTGY